MINKRKTYTTDRIKYALLVSLTFILFCSGNIGVMAQSTDEVNTSPSGVQDTTVHKVVEQMPEFPGGMNTFMKWFAKNMKYPEIAQKEKIQGKVIVSFIVEKDGSITNAEVKQSVSPVLDAEALRIINTMPAWIPGKVRGKAVRSYYSLPVMFNLQ